MTYKSSTQFRLDGILGIVLLVAFFVGIFFIMSGVFWVLKWIAPVLLIAAFIIDRSVVIGYGKWLLDTIKSKPLLGIGAVLFTIIGYMVVFPFLFAKSLFRKKVKDATEAYEKRKKGEFVEFEELSSESHSGKDETLELPHIQRSERKNSDYDQMFD